MKKEYKLVGKVTIPKKKRKEVKSIIQKILYLGGIREKETIEIDGRQCITAGIPKWNAREVISFNYNGNYLQRKTIYMEQLQRDLYIYFQRCLERPIL